MTRRRQSVGSLGTGTASVQHNRERTNPSVTHEYPPPTLFYTLATSVYILVKRIQDRFRLPLPPGPPGLPLLGNAHQMPPHHPWLQFSEWAKDYGDVVYLSIFGQPFIVLNSAKATTDLLEKRSVTYSDRPRMPMVGELVGYEDVTPLVPYGSRHRDHRKLMSSVLTPRKVEELLPMQEQKMHEFLNLLLESPEEFIPHIRRVVAATIFQLTHGYKVGKDDPFVAIAEQVNVEFGLAATPGAFLVDVFPILKHVPEWLPGAGFKLKAKQWRKTMMRLRDEPYEFVKRQVAEGIAPPSFAATLIEEYPNATPEEEHVNRWTTATIYSAGADTSTSAISTFFLAMTVYPEVQRKAQTELDRVVGTARLPTFEDRPNLPYINAIAKEVHRWLPALPLAVPHRVMQEDVYQGRRIPAGATIFPNSWGILHDPTLYPDPSVFNPERFLSKSKAATEINPDPANFAFGYGRRVCPGSHIGDNTLFIAVAMTLAVFNISNALDDQGKPIEPEVASSTGTICHPVPFKCHITPRSPVAVGLVREVYKS